MIKIIALMFIIIAQAIFSKSLADNELPFPVESQRRKIAVYLFSGIESIDAITINLRNKTRKVDWKTYKEKSIEKIANSSNWSSFYQSLDNIHYGILSRHSYVLVDRYIENKANPIERWPSIELGYSWPEVSFFSTKNHKDIESINGFNIEKIFDQFFNYYCNDIHQSGCLKLFSDYMKSGYRFMGKADKLVINFKDGSSELIVNKKDEKNKKQKATECQKMYPSLYVELIYAGNQSCLYQKNDILVLKIFHFGKWGTSSDDIYCEHAAKKGMCSDINEIKRVTTTEPEKHLVIDLQDNKGGTENTPWIAALTYNGFKDNLVLYKNISILSDPEIRSSAFYHSDRAETWYKKITKNVSSSDVFLPLRADFCRGASDCDVRTIKSSPTPIKYKSLKLVINENCVSSCDDFIWRTRQYANAKTYGQLSATDGAYARLNGYLFIDQNGKLTNVIAGEGIIPSNVGATLLVAYQIPISKTVDINGDPLEGDGSILDNILPINKSNFGHITEDNLARALNM